MNDSNTGANLHSDNLFPGSTEGQSSISYFSGVVSFKLVKFPLLK